MNIIGMPDKLARAVVRVISVLGGVLPRGPVELVEYEYEQGRAIIYGRGHRRLGEARLLERDGRSFVSTELAVLA